MLFSAKVVEERVAGQLLVTASLISFIFILSCIFIPALQFLLIFFFTALILLVVIIAIYNNGNLSNYKIENDLIIFDEELQICHIVFPMREIHELEFSFGSFNRLRDTDHYYDYRGMNNHVSFK